MINEGGKPRKQQKTNLPPAFTVDTTITVKIDTVDLCYRIGKCILDSRPNDKQVLAFAHALCNTIDDEEGQPQEESPNIG